jgi:ABC-type multidrug transport system fused ATPase/permease subunit
MAKVPSLLFAKNFWTFVGIAAALGNAISRVAIIPIFISPIFNQVIQAGDMSALPEVLAVSGIVVFVGSVLIFIQDFSFDKAAFTVSKLWRYELYRRLLLQRPGTLKSTSSGLSSRLLSDLREIESYYHHGLGGLIAESVALIVTLGYLLYKNTSVTLILMVLIVPVVILLRWLGGYVERSAETSQASVEHLGSTLQEGFKHHTLIRSFLSDAFILGRAAKAINLTTRLMTRRSLLMNLQTPLAQIFIFTLLGGLITLLIQRVNQGQMSLGDLVAYLTLVVLMSTPAQLLPRAYATLMQARGASKRLKDLWPRLEPSPEKDPLPLDSQPCLELSEVSFAYGHEVILNKLSLRISGPGLVALTGESGSGKTTLLSILLRFLLPQGRILVSGQGLDQLPEKQLRNYLAYVPQGSDLISGSLRDNLCLGREFNDDDLWKVLQDVQLADVVKRLGGLDYKLGEDGSGLSGGQMQRLAIARALLSHPGILLLDEPTSNLDADTEVALVEMLKNLSRERLVIAVAHRPALVQVADKVLILEQGRLI